MITSDDARRAYFDHLADAWDAEEPSAEAMAWRLSRHADLLRLAPGEALLEVGCGTGKTTPWLAEQVAPGRVMGVDFAPRMIAHAEAKGIEADFACVDVCSDALGSERYDVVLCFHSFPHFRDQPAALRTFAKALKPAGRLIVMHLAGSDHINEFHAGLEGPVRGDILPVGRQWEPLLEAAGFRLGSLIDREDLFYVEATRRA